jgi:hypothetical protein
VVLPTALSTTATTVTPKRTGAVPPDTASKKKKAKTPGATPTAKDPVSHPNAEPVAAWTLPAGVEYLDIFGSKIPRL